MLSMLGWNSTVRVFAHELLLVDDHLSLLQEIVVGSNMDKIYIVMDFVEHDLKSLMENMKNPFLVGKLVGAF